jgi:hypothetical protein
MRIYGTVALISAVALGSLALTGTASADTVQTLTRSTWAPGYTWDDGGFYYKTVVTPGSPNLRGSVATLRSDSWKPGYIADDEGGGYTKTIALGEEGTEFMPAAGKEPRMEVDTRATWAPGYIWNDGGFYERDITTSR